MIWVFIFVIGFGSGGGDEFLKDWEMELVYDGIFGKLFYFLVILFKNLLVLKFLLFIVILICLDIIEKKYLNIEFF